LATPEVSLDNEQPLEYAGLLSQSDNDEKGDGVAEGEPENNSEMHKLLRNAVMLCDPLTKLALGYSLYILIFAMALLSTTLPFALSNFLLLVIMTVLVIRVLQMPTQIEFF